MGKCTVCGKKGLFLKINPFGMCQSCEIAFEKQETERKQKELLEYQKKEAEKRALEEEKARKKAEYEATHKKAYFLDILDGQYILSYQYDFVNITIQNEKDLKLGSFLSLEAEPDNPHDPYAVKVLSGTDKIGYLSQEKLQKMATDFIRKGLPIEARIDSITSDGCTCGLGFYKDIDSFDSVTATLTKTSKKDEYGDSRQDNLSCISEEDILFLEYNYDSETYIVTNDCGSELGELSKSLSYRLHEEEDDYKYTVICIENELDDNFKYKCKVKILKMFN